MITTEAALAKGVYVHDGEVIAVRETPEGEFVQEATGLEAGAVDGAEEDVDEDVDEIPEHGMHPNSPQPDEDST